MGIYRIEELEDRVKIHFVFQNQSPIPDGVRVSEVLYSDIPKLPIAPPVQKGKYDPRFWAERAFVPRVNRILEYHFREWQESPSSLMQDLHGGPYLGNPDKER